MERGTVGVFSRNQIMDGHSQGVDVRPHIQVIPAVILLRCRIAPGEGSHLHIRAAAAVFLSDAEIYDVNPP